MKIRDLLEDMKWRKHPTKKGVLMRTVTPEDLTRKEVEKKRKELEQRWKAEEKAAEKRKERIDSGKLISLTAADYNEIARKIEDVVGNVVPDGDPIDWLIPFMKRKFGLTYNLTPYFDKALKKRHGPKSSYDDYLADSWDGYYESTAENHEEYEKLKKNNPWR